MENMSCEGWLNDILVGQRNIQIAMEAAIHKLAVDARESWILDPRAPKRYIADDWVGDTVMFDNTRVKVVKHFTDQWMFFIQNVYPLQINPNRVWETMNVPKEDWPDIYKLNVYLPAVEVNGHIMRPSYRDVWLYDPRKTFWPRGK